MRCRGEFLWVVVGQFLWERSGGRSCSVPGPTKTVFFFTEPSNNLWQASLPETSAVSRKAQQLAENLGSLPQQRVSSWGRFFQHAAEVSGKRPVFSEDCRN